MTEIHHADSVGWRLKQCSILFVAVRLCLVFGELIIEPKDICTARVRELCHFIRDTGLSKLC